MNSILNVIFTRQNYLQQLRVLTAVLCCTWLNLSACGQEKIPLLKASSEKAFIADGPNVKLAWRLDPKEKPDRYYVNIPGRKSSVVFHTNESSIRIRTRPGMVYQLQVLLGQDTCHIEIASVLPPNLPKFSHWPGVAIIPIEIRDSKVFFSGNVNQKPVRVQFDLGAGTGVVNRNASERLGLSFSSHKIVSNTSGLNRERTSLDNHLAIGGLSWDGVSLTEVGNMKDYEDLIIGNGFFRDQIIGLDYDTQQFMIYPSLPQDIGTYTKVPVYYEQDRPKFKARISQGGKHFDFWFLFDTGRDGTMLLGEDFTGVGGHWQQLEALTVVNGRKIVRLDAHIAGLTFRDIVTNAADPARPGGRPSLFGNQLLSHFNVILDNRNGFLYLKPNSQQDNPYYNYERFLQDQPKKD
ncbi:retropepsin-like aspartic protease [Pedobacter aquatilis]|uniref:retropepsin-like aspartic protease n=1 Tax=Pedobacter aquatilis TaxID=351343 RepID=UPI00292F56A1|nr:retropepsin-like aspartic protease [Pedobacter aquatilis]